MFRTAIALAETCHHKPRDAAGWLAHLAYLWGGGIIVMLGLLFFWLWPSPQSEAWIWRDAFTLDPGDGFWFLNLGRNVYYSTEAVYHVLFLHPSFLSSVGIIISRLRQSQLWLCPILLAAWN